MFLTTTIKTVSLSLLWNFSKLVLIPYIRSGFFERVKAIVLEMMDQEIEGKEKHRLAREWLDVEYDHISGTVKNLVIELTVAKYVLPLMNKTAE